MATNPYVLIANKSLGLRTKNLYQMTFAFLLLSVTLSVYVWSPSVERISYQIGVVSIILGIVLCSGFIKYLLDNKMSTFWFSMLGFGVFGFIDIGKYIFYESRFRSISADSVFLSIIFIYISLSLFIIGYNIVSFQPMAGQIKQWNQTNLSSKRFASLLIPSAVILLLVFTSFSQFQRHPYFSIIGYSLKSFLLLTFFLYVLRKRKYYLGIFLLFMPFVMIDSSRRAFLSVFFPVIILSVLGLKNLTLRNKINHKVFILLLVLILFFGVNLMRASHDFGDEYKENEYLANTIFYMKTLKSIDTFYNTAFILENFPQKYEFYMGTTYLSVPVGIIPRTFWSDKPVGLGAPLGLLQRGLGQHYQLYDWVEINYLSLSPGLIAEAYANFGSMGILVIPFLLGIGSKYSDSRYLSREKGIHRYKLEFLPLMVSFFLIHRGDFYSALIYNIFIMLFLGLSLYIIKKRESTIKA